MGDGPIFLQMRLLVLFRVTVGLDSLDDLPPEAARDRKAYDAGGNKSNVTVPVKLGDKVVGGGWRSAPSVALKDSCVEGETKAVCIPIDFAAGGCTTEVE